MRRTDRERNDAGGGRGFRVLEAGGRYLEPLSPPPPPRAPEPYKVAPSSLGRAHRRSSFVIIAETRPATPSSASPSPTLLATGRVSPFRGRGFKGPLPHAQSRSESPENRHQTGRRHGRFDGRASVSQQSSPKRSLIPQPTRRRSVSLTKSKEKKPSPKFGRRAPVTRRSANGASGPTGGGNISRRHSLKAPDLSPIQGTPTKPVEVAPRVRGGNSLGRRVSPGESRSSLAVPKNVGNARRDRTRERSPIEGSTRPRRFVEEKRPKGENGSPTKIPVRRGSVVNKNGSARSLSSSRFVGTSGKPGDGAAKAKNEPSKREGNSNGGEKRLPGRSGSRDGRREDDRSNEDPPGSRFIEMNSSAESKRGADELGLMDLLKQTSGATGTSSMVNTTTASAVQPLRIEAAAILLDNDRATVADVANGKGGRPSPSPGNFDVSSDAGTSPTVTSDSASLPKTPNFANGREETGPREQRIGNRINENGNSSTTSDGSSQKNPGKGDTDESTGASNPSIGKKDPNVGSSNGQSQKEKAGKDEGAAGVSSGPKKSTSTRNGLEEGSRGEARVASAKPGARTGNTNDDTDDGSDERNGSGRAESNGTSENVEASGKLLGGKGAEGVSSLTSGHRKSDSKGSARSTAGSVNCAGNDGRTLSRNAGAGNPEGVEPARNPGIRATVNGEGNKFLTNHGSETSLKSSNGLSTGSVDSARSTDTGVSVDTVRGLSSAREKKGMHAMKNSDEIETLSGNVMHLERNGEPAVLDIAESPEEAQALTRLGRFKKSLARIHDRLPSMRCLGCRRGRKGHPWPGEHRSQDEDRPVPPAIPSTADASDTAGNRIWNNFKNVCRCTRLRECRCCRRAARVAPAESSTPCCPPERRCGALCRRLFSRCKCDKSEAERTRSIRAKHSLTSVAPPLRSEDQRSKIPEVLVEHNSVMRGAIPCLPVPLAWFCLVWNVLIPGSGTVWSGLFNLCAGQPRFAISASPRARFGALVVNLIVGVGQLFTVLFCLVGWGWSIWWGVTMIRLARKYKRFRASEAASSDLEARAGESTALPPGMPSQPLRGMERAR